MNKEGLKTTCGSLAPTNRVYIRRKAMDDVLLPFVNCAFPKQGTEKTSRPKQKSYALKTFFTAVLISAVMFSTNATYTISYFNDKDVSTLNKLLAGRLDFGIHGNDFSVVLESDTEETVIVPSVNGYGGLDFEYRVTVEFVSGVYAFCDMIKAKSLDPFAYDGELLALDSGTTTTRGDMPITLRLVNGANPSPDDTCIVDLVYQGWQAGGAEERGYHDKEIVHLSIGVIAPQTQTLNMVPFSITEADESHEEATSTEGDQDTSDVPESGDTKSQAETSHVAPINADPLPTEDGSVPHGSASQTPPSQVPIEPEPEPSEETVATEEVTQDGKTSPQSETLTPPEQSEQPTEPAGEQPIEPAVEQSVEETSQLPADQPPPQNETSTPPQTEITEPPATPSGASEEPPPPAPEPVAIPPEPDAIPPENPAPSLPPPPPQEDSGSI